ncbi:putative disease resistance protein At3g14460 [Lotus japonicus]|uniref:putative disease resistance protein At3g14460 n=1 Tax=Lotus japonicus TaxID=34305 RepID=UPI00258B6E63|nr:putative disease resistance protein At3g14460 [Lotus japonicus]XP_057453621.1 putative disease resistance protein At3g14460 [Lotus japonicus]
MKLSIIFDKKIESRMHEILGNLLALSEVGGGFVLESGNQASQKFASKSLVIPKTGLAGMGRSRSRTTTPMKYDCIWDKLLHLRYLRINPVLAVRYSNFINMPYSTTNLKSLKLVGLNETLLEHKLAHSISHLRFLQSLDLSGTAIEDLPDSMCFLHYLTNLNLAGCSKLHKLSDSIGNFRLLEHLDLSGTAIEDLPDSMCFLYNLTNLNLAGCAKLQKLPGLIGNLRLLKYLNLSGTAIQELPDSTCFLHNLTDLVLAGCSKLQKLPDSIGDLRLLNYLNLSGTAIEQLLDSTCSQLSLVGCENLQELPIIQTQPDFIFLNVTGKIMVLEKEKTLKALSCMKSNIQPLRELNPHRTLIYSELVKEGRALPKLRPYNLELTNCFYGRQKEKDQVIEFLLSMSDSDDDSTNTGMPVLGIVGPGGIGKTTLTRVVYEDHKVKAWFELRVWLTFPSYQLDAETLARIMLGILKVDFDQDDVLQDLIPLLRKSFTGRRLLLVLDGCCVVHQWKILQACFECAARGSAIILATGTTEAALQMLADHVLHLDFLSMEHCWSVFSEHCFGNQRPGCSPQLEEVGRKILEKCGGVPLAAKMLGGLLHKKEYKEWVDIWRSPEWDRTNMDLPIPFVRLFYLDLPSQLKPCITYLVIFPKGYKFKKREVVLLWMAEGFIPQEYSETMEELGYKYFDFLVARSFLIRSHSGDSMDFTMHDMVHDLALSLANFHFSFDGNGDIVDTSGLISDMQYFERTSSELHGSRTEEDMNLKYSTYIADTSHGHGAQSPINANADVQNTFDLRTCFESLKVSNVLQLVNLPSSLLMNKCTNLAELYIIGCFSLKNLTEQWYPSSLRTLYLHKCRKLEFLLPFTCNFEFLEHLFIGSSCESMKSLTLNLFPKLKLLCIWDCPNLESLTIEESQSNNLSLESLDIRGCSNLVSFPAKGLLSPCLRSLSVSNCENLRSLPNYMNSLTSLQSVILNRCPELESLPEGGLPSCLKLLSIGFCDKLIPQKEWNLKSLHCLHRFEIESGCMGMKSFPEKDLFPINLNSLYISKLPSLEVLDYRGLQQLTALESLEINYCEKLSSLPEVLPSSLTFLGIKESPMLTQKLLNPVGADWFKIAHISNIKINDSVFSR